MAQALSIASRPDGCRALGRGCCQADGRVRRRALAGDALSHRQRNPSGAQPKRWHAGRLDRGDHLFRADDALSHRQRNPADLSLVHELGLLGWVGAVENLRGPQATDQHRRERACRPSSEVASSGEFTGAVNGSTNGGASACTRVSSRCAVFTCPFFFLPLLLLPRCLEET